MIHIIWTGKGYLVFVFTFCSSLLANFITDYVTGSEAYWDAHKWPLAISLFVSAQLSLIVGRIVHEQKARVLIDPQTGKDVILRESHTLFFIPMIWWGLILNIFGVIALCFEFLK